MKLDKCSSSILSGECWFNIIKICAYLVRASDKRVTNDGEYSDSEDEGEGRRDEKNHKSPRKKVRQGSPVANMVADATKTEEPEAVKPQNGAKANEEPSKEKTEEYVSL